MREHVSNNRGGILESKYPTMKNPTAKPTDCSRRSFLSTCIFSAVSVAATPTLLAGEATPPESIDIPSYSPEQARSKILHYIQNGWEAPLSVLLGVLIAKSWGLSSEDRPIEVMKNFFSVPAVRRILKYAAKGNADERDCSPAKRTGQEWEFPKFDSLLDGSLCMAESSDH